MGVMICLGQGGLHSLSASSLLDFYLLGKGGYVFGSIGLSVCLSVDNITQKVVIELG